ncbi:hypothetical protein [Nonomuraea sp. NPDC049709]
MDHVTLDPRALDPTGFADVVYREQAELGLPSPGRPRPTSS